MSASVQGRVALGRHAGTRVERLVGEPPERVARSHGPRQAHLDGYDLHADVRVPPNVRVRLEHLCRYLLRPPLAQDRLHLRTDGRVVVTLKRAWRDGTTRLVFEPLEFLAKLAALTPRPEINLLLYHGVLAPHARWRAQVVSYGRPISEVVAPGPLSSDSGRAGAQGAHRPRNATWAGLMRRAFAIDVLACARCGGRMRVIGTVEDPSRCGRFFGPDPPAGAPTNAR